MKGDSKNLWQLGKDTLNFKSSVVVCLFLLLTFMFCFHFLSLFFNSDHIVHRIKGRKWREPLVPAEFPLIILIVTHIHIHKYTYIQELTGHLGE